MVTNAWAKYRRDAEECGDLPTDILCLYDFKASVGMSLLKVGSSAAHVGRKSAIEHRYLEKRKLGGKKHCYRQRMFDLII